MTSKWMLAAAVAITGIAVHGVDKFLYSSHHSHVPIPSSIAHRERTDNLIVSCVDHRFRPIISDWAEEVLGDSADHVAWPGGSKSITDQDMRSHTTRSLHVLVKKHQIKKIHLMNHLQCAGHPLQAEDQEMAYHRGELQKAALILRHEIPGTEVICYLVGFDGVHRVD